MFYLLYSKMSEEYTEINQLRMLYNGIIGYDLSMIASNVKEISKIL